MSDPGVTIREAKDRLREIMDHAESECIRTYYECKVTDAEARGAISETMERIQSLKHWVVTGL